MSRRLQRLQASVVLCLAPALGAVAGSPAHAARAVQTPGPDALGTGPLVAGLSLVAWAMTAWLVLVLTLSLASQLPGALGRCADVASVRVAPASVRAIVRTATGLAVAGTVLLGSTSAHADPNQPGITVTLDWPTATTQPTASSTTASATTAPTTPAVATTRATLPAHPLSAEGNVPAFERPVAHVRTAPLAAGPGVVVQPGDCLWHLAEKALGPTATPRQVAQSWPTWWTANRDVIGDDPNLLRPGTTLQPPTS